MKIVPPKLLNKSSSKTTKGITKENKFKYYHRIRNTSNNKLKMKTGSEVYLRKTPKIMNFISFDAEKQNKHSR